MIVALRRRHRLVLACHVSRRPITIMTEAVVDRHPRGNASEKEDATTRDVTLSVATVHHRPDPATLLFPSRQITSASLALVAETGRSGGWAAMRVPDPVPSYHFISFNTLRSHGG